MLSVLRHALLPMLPDSYTIFFFDSVNVVDYMLFDPAYVG